MGTDYGFACIDCKDNYVLSDYRVWSDSCHDALAMLKELTALGKVIKDSDTFVSFHSNRLDLSFFVKHEGHRIRVVDEYGRVDDTCGADVVCKTCNHAPWRWKCLRPIGHDGEHSRESED